MSGSGILKNSRILAVTLLGFSSGLPFALSGSTLQAWFTQAGIHLMTIGMLSLVGVPYIFKFLWSPILDRFVPPLWGRRRGWIGITQLGLCIALFALANLTPTTQAHWMGVLAFVIAFLSASQDIAIDAYRTDTFLPSERGMGSALFIFASRVAIIISSGLALIFADHIGWRYTYELMAMLMACSILVTYYAPEISEDIQPPKSFLAAIIEPLKDLYSRKAIFSILLFILIYKIGDALALSLMSTFLLRWLGFTLTDVGVAYKVMGFAASIIGAFVGGSLITRIGLYRGLLYFGLAQAFSNLLFMLLAIVGKNYGLMLVTMFIENFCSGMSATALLVFITALCHKQYSATQFACLSALFAVARVFLGPVAAFMVKQIGWVNFFGWSFLICFPAIFLLFTMRDKVIFNVEAMA